MMVAHRTSSRMAVATSDAADLARVSVASAVPGTGVRGSYVGAPGICEFHVAWDGRPWFLL